MGIVKGRGRGCSGFIKYFKTQFKYILICSILAYFNFLLRVVVFTEFNIFIAWACVIFFLYLTAVVICICYVALNGRMQLVRQVGLFCCEVTSSASYNFTLFLDKRGKTRSVWSSYDPVYLVRCYLAFSYARRVN